MFKVTHISPFHCYLALKWNQSRISRWGTHGTYCLSYEGMVRSFGWYSKTEASCHRRYSTIWIPPSSKPMNSVHGRIHLCAMFSWYGSKFQGKRVFKFHLVYFYHFSIIIPGFGLICLLFFFNGMLYKFIRFEQFGQWNSCKPVIKFYISVSAHIYVLSLWKLGKH